MKPEVTDLQIALLKRLVRDGWSVEYARSKAGIGGNALTRLRRRDPEVNAWLIKNRKRGGNITVIPSTGYWRKK